MKYIEIFPKVYKNCFKEIWTTTSPVKYLQRRYLKLLWEMTTLAVEALKHRISSVFVKC